MTSILLPEPLWGIHPTIGNNKIVIVGYSTTGRTTTSYQLPVDKITTSTTPGPTSDHPVQWMKLPSTPHHYTRIIPDSHPTVIIGGYHWPDLQYVPTVPLMLPCWMIPIIKGKGSFIIQPQGRCCFSPHWFWYYLGTWRDQGWRRCCRSYDTFHHYSREGKSYPHTKNSCYSYKRNSV